mmetsp:Transcript_41818/g.63922  ORF Transcript_41818/g.63922 Transcript_41818/m.63922 type:complete len:170 (+) Transcript_41818:494-1003(+)
MLEKAENYKKVVANFNKSMGSKLTQKNSYHYRFLFEDILHEQRREAIRCVNENRQVWLKANFEMADSEFYKRWRSIEPKQPLYCNPCLERLKELEFKDPILAQMDSLVPFDTSLEGDDELRDLLIKKKRCVSCSKRWCKFLHDMVLDYVDQVFFAQFTLKKTYVLKTKV